MARRLTARLLLMNRSCQERPLNSYFLTCQIRTGVKMQCPLCTSKTKPVGSFNKLLLLVRVPVFAPVFLQISIYPCNLLHLIYFKLNWYKGIQICVNQWKSRFETHNQGVAGSSPAGPTVDNQPLGVIPDWLVFLLG